LSDPSLPRRPCEGVRVDQGAVKAVSWEIFDIFDDIDEGDEAVAEATGRAEQVAPMWSGTYPRAVECLQDGLELLVTHPHYRRTHWTRERHTDLIEPTFGETRRRVKVLGRLPDERSALSLVSAVLDRAAAARRGFTHSPPTSAGCS
jgi:putative transposase